MQVLNFTEIRDGKRPYMLAEFDVYLEAGITFHKLKVIRTKKGYLHVSMPSYSVQSDDGSKKFLPYISFSEARGTEFNKKVLDELKPLLSN